MRPLQRNMLVAARSAVPLVITGDKGSRLHAPKNLLRLNRSLTLFRLSPAALNKLGRRPVLPEQQVEF